MSEINENNVPTINKPKKNYKNRKKIHKHTMLPPIRVSEKLKEETREAADLLELSISDYVIRAIEAYTDDEKTEQEEIECLNKYDGSKQVTIASARVSNNLRNKIEQAVKVLNTKISVYVRSCIVEYNKKILQKDKE